MLQIFYTNSNFSKNRSNVYHMFVSATEIPFIKLTLHWTALPILQTVQVHH